MCGAQIMPYTSREIWERYNYYLHGIKDARPNDIQPHYALRPSMSSPIVRIHDGETEICNARWGVAASALAGIELVNMIRKGQFTPGTRLFQQFAQLAE